MVERGGEGGYGGGGGEEEVVVVFGRRVRRVEGVEAPINCN